jgi:hypothetical protein
MYSSHKPSTDRGIGMGLHGLIEPVGAHSPPCLTGWLFLAPYQNATILLAAVPFDHTMRTRHG